METHCTSDTYSTFYFAFAINPGISFSFCSNMALFDQHLDDIDDVLKVKINPDFIDLNWCPEIRYYCVVWSDSYGYLLQSSTIREFDSRFTAKMFGYSSCDDYYHAATLHNKIHALRVPVLVLSAEDDPFSPSHGQSNNTKTRKYRG